MWRKPNIIILGVPIKAKVFLAELYLSLLQGTTL